MHVSPNLTHNRQLIASSMPQVEACVVDLYTKPERVARRDHTARSAVAQLVRGRWCIGARAERRICSRTRQNQRVWETFVKGSGSEQIGQSPQQIKTGKQHDPSESYGYKGPPARGTHFNYGVLNQTGVLNYRNKADCGRHSDDSNKPNGNKRALPRNHTRRLCHLLPRPTSDFTIENSPTHQVIHHKQLTAQARTLGP